MYPKFSGLNYLVNGNLNTQKHKHIFVYKYSTVKHLKTNTNQILCTKIKKKNINLNQCEVYTERIWRSNDIKSLKTQRFHH